MTGLGSDLCGRYGGSYRRGLRTDNVNQAASRPPQAHLVSTKGVYPRFRRRGVGV